MGGAQENTLLSSEGAGRTGRWNVTILSGRPRGKEGELRPPAPDARTRLEYIPFLSREVSPWRDALAFLALWASLRRLRPDVVHTHSAKGGILGRWAASLAGVPRIVHTVHGPFVYGTLGSPWRQLARLAERLTAPVTDAWVTVSRRLADDLVSMGIAPRSRVRVVYSGMRSGADRPATDVRARWASHLGLAEGARWIVVVGRHYRLKGQEFLIEALPAIRRIVPDAAVLLVGDGAYHGALRQRARSHGVEEAVRWCGRLAPEEVSDLLGACDLLVHASLREGVPRVLVQAQWAGLPAVAFDLDGAREARGPGCSLVPAGDVRALSHLVSRTLLKGTRGGEAPALAVRFGSIRMVEALLDLYEGGDLR
ncbi:MAG: glycosyltransferase [Planctomycetes bacterium]|nr:glycosyltransferase [Planctomycetota bacterium]